MGCTKNRSKSEANRVCSPHEIVLVKDSFRRGPLFADRFLFRGRIPDALNTAANQIGPKTLLASSRIGHWESADSSNLGTVTNSLANYLNAGAERN